MGARKPRSTWHRRPYQADKWTHQLPEVVINKKTSQQYEQEGGKGRAGLIWERAAYAQAQPGSAAPAEVQVWVTQRTSRSPCHGNHSNGIQSGYAVLHLSFSPLISLPFPVLSTFLFLRSLERTVSIVCKQTSWQVTQPWL